MGCPSEHWKITMSHREILPIQGSKKGPREGKTWEEEDKKVYF